MSLKTIYHKLIGSPKKIKIPEDFEEDHRAMVAKVAPFTMTSPERIFSLIEAIKYIHREGIIGDIVECGVWKGGSMLAAADTLMSLQDTGRQLYLYDTFEGMSQPTDKDLNYRGEKADDILQQDQDKDHNLVWAYSTLDTVKHTMNLSNYPASQIKYIVGKVEDTIPATLPERIALLRLDTDWYESTKHELVHLFPRLQPGGVLIIDDYGFWQGARKAVDEYFSEQGVRILLNRIDETGRIAVKQ